MAGETLKENYAETIYKYYQAIHDVFKEKIDDDILIGLFKDLASMLRYQIHNVLVFKNSKAAELEIRRYLRDVVNKIFKALDMRITDKSLTTETQKRYLEVYKEFYALVAFRSMEHFAYYMDWERPDDKKVWKYSMPSMRGAFYHGNRMIIDGSVSLMRLSCPVAYGKTYFMGIAAVFQLGVDPQARVLNITESDPLVRAMIRNVRAMLISREFSEVFPFFQKYNCDPTQMFTTDTTDTLIFECTRSTYSFISTTRLGASNGLRSDLLLIDDLTKGIADAGNIKLHEEILKQYDSVWSTRADGVENQRTIFGGTMWAVFDTLNILEKRVADKMKIEPDPLNKYTRISEDKKNVFISVPNLDYETDESTLPKKFPTEYLRNLRDNVLDEEEWSARCQQQPIEPKGLYFTYSQLKTYEILPTSENCSHFALIDPPRTGKNYAAFAIFRKNNDEHYLVDVIFRKQNIEKCYDEIVDKIIKHKVSEMVFENNVNASLGDVLTQKLKERGYFNCKMRGEFTTEKKEQKIYDNRNTVREQMIFPKRGLYALTSEMGQFMKNLTDYSFERKNDYDDAPDACAMYSMYFVNRATGFAQFSTFKRN